MLGEAFKHELLKCVGWQQLSEMQELSPGGRGGYLGQFLLGMCRWPL